MKQADREEPTCFAPEGSGIRAMFSQHHLFLILGFFQILEYAIKHISHVITAYKKRPASMKRPAKSNREVLPFDNTDYM
ncbi:MAG: hypothetical protein CMN56_01610 [Sneathiella sp.]|nr:hypothetical protein [Sneathiella sp.]|tara:strand:+ start:689 stop:925 length:237 start_codon:yes stop_codon:yes gene_type:complete